MKRIMGLKKAAVMATAVATITTSMFAVPVFASNTAPEWNTQGGQETVHGDTYFVEPVVEVELPGDLTFGVNPLKMNVSEDPNKTDNSQIISGTYLVTNFSNVPVAVSAVTTVTAGSNVVLKEKTMAAADWDAANKQLKAVDGKKAVLLVQLYPKTIDNDGNMTVTPIVQGTTIAKDMVGDILTTAEPDTTVYFVMDAYDEKNASKSMGGFKFDGAVDPNAAFTEEDLKVKTVFTMDILTEEQQKNNYVDYTTNGGKATKGSVAATVKGKK